MSTHPLISSTASSSHAATGLSLPLPTVMQLERLWFESFADKAAAQSHEARALAVREASRRLMRAVKRRLDPSLQQRQRSAAIADPTLSKPVDRALLAEAEAAERAALQLADQMQARRAAVLARVRERNDKKLRLLYDAPIRAASADAAAVEPVAVEAIVSVRLALTMFFFLSF